LTKFSFLERSFNSVFIWARPHSRQNDVTCVVYRQHFQRKQTARSQLAGTHQKIPPNVSLNAKTLPHLFALERCQAPTRAHELGEVEEAAMLVEGLDVVGAVARVVVETLGDAAVEEGRAEPCSDL
jgi:hypothetical protein